MVVDVTDINYSAIFNIKKTLFLVNKIDCILFTSKYLEMLILRLTVIITEQSDNCRQNYECI